MSGYYETQTYTYEVVESRKDFIGFDDITICRPKLIYFKVTGLRPNTRHFAFLDNRNVTNYINTSIATINDFKNLGRNDTKRNPGELYVNETGFPTALGGPTGSIFSNNEGKIEGVFYLQSNSTLNFPAGTRTLSFIDISQLNRQQALSYAEGRYSANGGIENYKISYYSVTKTGTQQVWVDTPDNDPPSNDSGGGDNDNSSSDMCYPGPESSDINSGNAGDLLPPEKPKTKPVPNPSEAHSSQEDDDESVICTALYSLGLLPNDIYKLDAEFGILVNTHDRILGDGYRLWATPVAKYIKGESIGSKIALIIVTPIARAWAYQMAHVMRPEQYKANLLGKIIMTVGHPLCRMIGTLFLQERKNINDVSS